MTTLEVLDMIAPELAGLDTSRKNSAITLASQRLSPLVFGALYQQAAAYMAAHILTLADRGGSGGLVGAITSVKTGGLSVNSRGSAVASGLGSTHYGEEYLNISNRVLKTPVVRP